MCTSIVEIAAAEGMAKANGTWFELTHSVVAYDHARHAVLGAEINRCTKADTAKAANIEAMMPMVRDIRAA